MKPEFPLRTQPGDYSNRSGAYRHIRHLEAILFLILALPAAIPASSQDASSPLLWTSIQGQTIQGRFVKLLGEAVVIDKEGMEFTIPLARLSDASKAQAKSLAGASRPSPDKPGPASLEEAKAAATQDWHLKFTPATFAQLPAAQAKLDRDHANPGLLSAAIAHATNEARIANGAVALKYSAALTACAQGHSRDMSTLGFFSHENPKIPERRTMTQRLAAQGIVNVAAGENISSLGAAGHTYLSYAKAVVHQWMNSPGHRTNLLSPQFRFLGCAAQPCQCPDFHLIATQNFASEVPSSSATAVPTAPAAAALLNGMAQLVGKTATVPDGVPAPVRLAIEAGNALQTKGYKYGGGRDSLEDTGYDCSGSVSYVLIKAGLLKEPLTSGTLANYGKPGPGRWITISTTPGHAFITLCGLRLDTGGRGGTGTAGPRWNPYSRGGPGWTLRHPPGM